VHIWEWGSHQWKKSCAAWTISFAKGKILHAGHLGRARLVGRPRQILWRRFEAGHSSSGLQIEYSLIERTVERETDSHGENFRTWGFWPGRPWRVACCPGKYHGEGKADGGRMTNEGMKDFLPEGKKRAARIISALKAVSEQVGVAAWRKVRTRLVAVSNGASNPDSLERGRYLNSRTNLASLDLELLRRTN